MPYEKSPSSFCEIDFGSCDYDDEQFKEVYNSTNFNNVKTINLSGNKLTDKSANLICYLIKLNIHLEHLYLDHNLLGDITAETLISVLGNNTSVIFISLNGNKIDNSRIDQIYQIVKRNTQEYKFIEKFKQRMKSGNQAGSIKVSNETCENTDSLDKVSENNQEDKSKKHIIHEEIQLDKKFNITKAINNESQMHINNAATVDIAENKDNIKKTVFLIIFAISCLFAIISFLSLIGIMQVIVVSLFSNIATFCISSYANYGKSIKSHNKINTNCKDNFRNISVCENSNQVSI